MKLQFYNTFYELKFKKKILTEFIVYRFRNNQINASNKK